MGCCNKDDRNDNIRTTKNRDVPEGVEPCCRVRGKLCVCLPYDDPFMISAQVIAIVAVFISWVWWLTFLISMIGMSLIQILWCCRQSRSMVSALGLVAMLCFLAQYGVGIYALVKWKSVFYCDIFSMNSYGKKEDIDIGGFDQPYDEYNSTDSYYAYNDTCQEERWATIAFVSGTLWATVAACIIYFVASGRHEKWEEGHSNSRSETNNGNNNVNEAMVEVGSVPEATTFVSAIAFTENDKESA